MQSVCAFHSKTPTPPWLNCLDLQLAHFSQQYLAVRDGAHLDMVIDLLRMTRCPVDSALPVYLQGHTSASDLASPSWEMAQGWTHSSPTQLKVTFLVRLNLKRDEMFMGHITQVTAASSAFRPTPPQASWKPCLNFAFPTEFSGTNMS